MAAVAQPKDRTKREHVAKVDRVVFGDPAQPFVILALTDGLTAVGPADPDRFDTATVYRFLGRWEDDARRGPRFRFGTYCVHGHHGRAGVVKYLCETVEGIGPKTAGRLWQEYGGSAVEKLRTCPGEVAETVGIPAESARAFAAELERAAATERTRIDLFDLFDRRGFQGRLIDACIDKWGAKAPGLIRRNPFAMLGLPSAGFKRCDKLWTDLGLPPAALKRQAVVAAHLLKTDRDGHVWVRADDLAGRLRGLVPAACPPKAFKLALRARLLARHRDAAGTLWLATYDRAASEERIVADVRRLTASPPRWPVDQVLASETDGDGRPSGHQVERLRLATAAAVGLFRGPPGTGKTFTLAHLVKACVAAAGRDRVAICAPTGKAAKRMADGLRLAGVDMPPRTIHGLLEVGRNGHDGDGWGFVRGADDPLDVDFLFCDETSMVDAGLMASLLAAVPTGGHVLLIGDEHQLPPVGPGAPFRDLIAAGTATGELTQVRRNAGQIVHACVRIRNGEQFEAADRFDLDATPPANLRLLPAADDAAIAGAVVEVLRRTTRFHPVWQTQVIVARNRGSAVGRRELNDRLQPLLNPDGLAVTGNPFRVGDKVICLRNSRLHVVAPVYPGACDEVSTDAHAYQVVADPDPWTGRPEPKEQFVANGEVGRVVAVAAGLTVARFSESDDLVKIPVGKDADPDGPDGDREADAGRGCNFDLAYAVTCHKLQGSEAPFVIVVCDESAGGIASSEWWYTAVSRASKACLIVGKYGVVDRQCKRRSLVRRKTFLAERLGEAAHAKDH